MKIPHIFEIFLFVLKPLGGLLPLYHHGAAPGGALTLESGMGMCRGHDPLFSGQSALASLPIYLQCAAQVPPFSVSRKKVCIFSLVLAKISTLKMQIFVPKTPHFSRKICSLDPTFGNLCGTHLPKQKLRASPPPLRMTSCPFLKWDEVYAGR